MCSQSSVKILTFVLCDRFAIFAEQVGRRTLSLMQRFCSAYVGRSEQKTDMASFNMTKDSKRPSPDLRQVLFDLQPTPVDQVKQAASRTY